MRKKFLIILSLIILIAAPVSGSAQTDTAPPALPKLDLTNLGQSVSDSLPDPISNFIDKLKGIDIKGSAGADGGSMDLSSAKGAWDSINNWFLENIGVSLNEIIKAIANLIIWVWELIIKLIKTGISYL
jgi:hypothetical protein